MKSKAFCPDYKIQECCQVCSAQQSRLFLSVGLHPQSASGPSDASLQLSVNTCQGQVKRPAAFALVFTAIVPLLDYVTGLNAA